MSATKFVTCELLFCLLNYYIYYNYKDATVLLSVCVCLSVSPFFRHDRRTVTKFGMHMRIDRGMVRTEGEPGGIFGGQK